MKRAEAGHVEPSPSTGELSDPSAEPRMNTPAKITIYWMFDELDVAPMDRKLSRAEVGAFMNETVRNVHPRACAESQWTYCDYDDDDYISLSEWCWCNGLDNRKLAAEFSVASYAIVFHRLQYLVLLPCYYGFLHTSVLCTALTSPQGVKQYWHR